MNKPKYDICNSIDELHRLRADLELERKKSGLSKDELRKRSNENAKAFFARVGANA